MTLRKDGLVRASSLLSATRGMTLVLQAVHFAIVARLLAPDAFAGFVAAIAVISITQALAEFGLLNTVVLRMSRREVEHREVVAQSVTAVALLFTAALAVSLPLAFVVLPAAGTTAFLLLLPWFAASCLQLPFVAARRHALEFPRLALADALSRVVPVVAVVPLLLVGRQWASTAQLVGVAAGLGAGSLVGLAVLVPSHWKGPFRRSGVRPAGRLISESVPLGATGALSLVHTRVDQVVLSGYGFRLQLGAYAVAYRLLDAALAVVLAAAGAAFPMLAAKSGRDRVELARLEARLLAVVAAALGIGVFCAAPQLVTLLGGDRYRAGAGFARLLAPALVVSVLNVGPAQVTIVEGKARSLLRIAALGVFCNLALNLGLDRHYGASAAAMATVASETLGFVLVARLAARSLPRSVPVSAAATSITAFLVGSFGARWAWHSVSPLAGAALVALALAMAARIVLRPGPVAQGSEPEAAPAAGPVKVVNVITSLVVGGAQETALRYCSRLDPARYRGMLVCGPDIGPEGVLHDKAGLMGVDVVTVPTLHRRMRPLADARSLVALTLLFRRERPAIVHTHSSKAGQLGRQAARLAGVPVVVHTVHGWSFHDGMSKPAHAAAVLVERLAARWTTAFVVVADADRETGIRLRIGRPDQYTVVRSAIELDDYRPAPGARARSLDALGLETTGPLIGTVTRFLPQKDPETLVRVLARIVAAIPGAQGVVVGDGPMRPQVERLVDELGVGASVHLLGPRHDVATLIPAFDVFLFTSRWEGLPRVVVEAAAAGLPIVATDVGGVSELLDDDSAVLVPAGDADALTAGVLALLQDRRRASSLGQAASGRAGAFGVEAMADDLQRLYERLTDAARPGPEPSYAGRSATSSAIAPSPAASSSSNAMSPTYTTGAPPRSVAVASRQARKA